MNKKQKYEDSKPKLKFVLNVLTNKTIQVVVNPKDQKFTQIIYILKLLVYFQTSTLRAAILPVYSTYTILVMTINSFCIVYSRCDYSFHTTKDLIYSLVIGFNLSYKETAIYILTNKYTVYTVCVCVYSSFNFYKFRVLLKLISIRANIINK